MMDSHPADLTYNLSWDGAETIGTSKMWPIFLSLNELAPQVRFQRKILVGLCVYKSMNDIDFQVLTQL